MFIFIEGLSNLYILSTATVFLAVIIALYCANFLKDDNEKQTNEVINQEDIEDDEYEEEYDTKEEEFAEGLVKKLKSTRLKELEESLTEDQLEEEKRVEREQLAAIFELLKRQETELNMKEIDESELSAQMGLYR